MTRLDNYLYVMQKQCLTPLKYSAEISCCPPPLTRTSPVRFKLKLDCQAVCVCVCVCVCTRMCAEYVSVCVLERVRVKESE